MSPLLAAQASLDRWVRAREARRVAPHYRACAQHLRRAVERAGLAVLGRDDPCLLALGQARRACFAAALAKVGPLVAAAYRRTLIQAYGRPLALRLLDTPRRLHAQTPRSRAAQLIADLPDRWGYRYQERLWRADAQSREELRRALMNAAATGQLAWREATRLEGLLVHDPTLPTHLARLERAAAAVLQGQPGAREAWTRAIRQAKAEIRRRTAGPRGTRALQETTVRALVRAVTQANQTRVRDAFETFIARRNRARALVVLRSEVNRAFQETSWETYRASPWVLGIRWTLSSTHTQVDECDAKAAVDVGLGPGVYYVSDLPFPDHPNGACALEPVLAPPALALAARPPQAPGGYAAVLAALRQGAIPRAWNRAGRRGEEAALAPLRQDLAALTRHLPRP